jgi:hypothetical protein
MHLRRPLLVSAIASLSALTAGAEPQVSAYPLASFIAASLPAFVRAEAANGPPRLSPATGLLTSADLGSSLAAYESGDSPLVAPPASARGRATPDPRLSNQSGKPSAAKAGKSADDDDDDDDDAPVSRPGSFNPGSTKIPSAFLNSKTVAPHTGSPDVSYDVNDKTTIGLFGDMKNTSRTDTRAAMSKPDREIGAGFTFQYKFGSH